MSDRVFHSEQWYEPEDDDTDEQAEAEAEAEAEDVDYKLDELKIKRHTPKR